MNYSLLFPGDIAGDKAATAAACGSIDPRTLYHLSLDRAFAILCEEDRIRATFLETLSKPAKDVRVINYRQAVLADFLTHFGFFIELSGAYDRFLALRDAHERERVALMRTIHNTNGSASAQQLMNIMSSASATLKRCISYVKQIDTMFTETVRIRPLASEGLTKLQAGFAEAAQSEAFKELTKLCAEVDNLHIEGPFGVRAEMASNGQIGECVSINVMDLDLRSADSNRRKFLFFKEKEPEHPTCVKVYDNFDPTMEKLRMSPLVAIAETIDAISNQLFLRFCPAGSELGFYDVAMRYVNKLKEKKCAYTYPTFTGDGILVEDLSDLVLLLTQEEGQEVVPNSVWDKEATGGTVVFGENNSGKTVYLRSVGTAQLLAQAGLPVPARTAQMQINGRLTTQFSEAEKEFERGNDAGRFEQEVRELAAVVDSLEPGSFVLLNETFQTTAYAEGAEGLYHILRFFRENGIRYLLVSHLRQLDDMLDRSSVNVLETQPGYHVVKQVK